MDNTAVNAIRDLAVQAAYANRIQMDMPAILVGDQVKSLEHLQSKRSRFRGTFNTQYLSEFVAYVKANKGGAGFIDAKACEAKVFFNLGTVDAPGHADWTGTLALEPTAAYAAVRKIDGQPIEQRALVEWIEDWAVNLSAPLEDSPDGTTDVGMALQAIRNLTITEITESTHTDRDLGATKSRLEDIEAKSKASKIPPYLIFNAVPYEGFAKRDFRLRLSVLTGNKPRLLFRIVSRQAVEEDIAQEFKAALIREVGDAAQLTIGTFKP